MDRMHEIFAMWYIKVAFGVLLTLFAPIQISIIIIAFMIFLDTTTGVACALKQKRFNSKSLRKNLKKVAVYATCLLTIRLVEVGTLASMDTIILSQIMAGFLIGTEAISILENLTILGLPIPTGFINILFKQLPIGALEELISKNQQEKKELGDIEDILYFQIPTIKSGNMRKLLEIKIETWLKVAKDIISYLNELQRPDNELIYYKVSSIIDRGFKDMYEDWAEERIPEECIEGFNKWHESRIQTWLKDVKEICFRIIPIDRKKDELIKKVTILLYKTILDAQKGENEMFYGECEKK